MRREDSWEPSERAARASALDCVVRRPARSALRRYLTQMDSPLMGLVVVVDEVAAGRVDDSCLPERPAVPYASGQREDALADADPNALRNAAAVTLERELVLGGVVDRFDPLTDAAKLAEPRLLALAVGTDERGVERGDGFSNSPEKPLSATMSSPPVSSPTSRARSSIAAATSRSPSLAGARAK
jgi:hypothetical protein